MILHHPNGTAYPLSYYGDVDANGRAKGDWTWVRDVPDCPACGSPLDDDSLGKRASVQPQYMAAELVQCDQCGWRKEIAS